MKANTFIQFKAIDKMKNANTIQMDYLRIKSVSQKKVK